MQIVPGCAQRVVRVGPLWFEPKGCLKLVCCRLGVAFIFQSKRQIVVCKGVVAFEREGLAVSSYGLVPGFVARELDGTLTICFSTLRESR